MTESKAWNWEIVTGEFEEEWKNPCVESFYLLNRWKSQNKKQFVDLGCGLGRHSVLFGKNGFDVKCIDLSENAVLRTKEWAEKEKLNFQYFVGDMLNLPFENDSTDCIICTNVISHTDTAGVKKAVSEI